MNENPEEIEQQLIPDDENQIQIVEPGPDNEAKVEEEKDDWSE